MMKNAILILLMAFSVTSVFAQKKKGKYETVSIQTSAECGQCKDRLEEMLNYTKGVKYAELDLETMKLSVKFAPAVISLQEIKLKISSKGYDADEVKADPDEVKKLPACCQPGGMKH